MQKQVDFKTFIRNRHFLKKAGVKMEYVDNDNSPYIYIDNPIIISSFAGYVKKHFPTKHIYFRGESRNNAHVIPSLFRQMGAPLENTAEIQARFRAYNELKRATIKEYSAKVSRFKNEDVDVFFQHYGIKSPVIDLVDNIYV